MSAPDGAAVPALSSRAPAWKSSHAPEAPPFQDGKVGAESALTRASNRATVAGRGRRDGSPPWVGDSVYCAEPAASAALDARLGALR
jgi:hypothetical protein